MDTKHLVDPELIPMLDQFPPLQFTPDILPQMRAMAAEQLAQMRPLMPEFPAIAVNEQYVPGTANAPEVRVLVYRPQGVQQQLPALLWIHGGGYVLGSAAQDDLRAKTIVDAVGCVVVSVDYRLAPETPHPGPVEDCYAALTWLHAHAAESGVDPNRIAIGGASAGGGLAAALGLLARDRGAVPVAFQLLIYPMLDDRTVTLAEPHPHTGEFIWNHDANRFGWSSLLGGEPGGADVSPYAAPARAEQLAGLPPTYLCVGALDLFLDEDLDYARRLLHAGVPTELHVYPGAYHGFNMVPDARVSLAFNRDLSDALRRALQLA
jgi:acetyl esterase/lipase